MLMTQSYGLSDTGCVRPNNEDYFLVAPDLGLYVLADGMGGAKAGETASQLAAETVDAVVRQADRRDTQILLQAIEHANEQVLATAKSDPTLEGMGTTLVVAMDMGGAIQVASVGDSRAYLLQDDFFGPITQDQSWVNEVGRAMGLDEGILRAHPLRHVLTMAIGAGANLVVNCYTREWKPGSVVLLSSDGLHGVVDHARIEEILREPDEEEDPDAPLEGKCRRLIAAARAAGAPDNVTVVLVRNKQ